MIHYRDKTFCRGDGCMAFQTCGRALTDEVRRRAEAAGLPISEWEEPKKLQCYQAPEPKTEKP